jgi:chemotaxis protein histidine kinase CheA
MTTIQIQNNYWADLTAAKEAGLFLPTAKPKKVDLYAAIEEHNKEEHDRYALAGAYGLAAQYAVEERLGIVPADPEVIEAAAEEPATALEIAIGDSVRRDVIGYQANQIGTVIEIEEGTGRARVQWAKNRTWFALTGLIKVAAEMIEEGPAEEPAIAVEPEAAEIAAEAEEDEEALQAALLAMDAAEDEIKAEQAEAAKKAKAAAKSSKKAPQEIMDELAALVAEVAIHGKKEMAARLGTSLNRLIRRVKAYEILQAHSDIREAFLAGRIGYYFLQESTIRRDGLDRLKAKAAEAQQAA